MVSTDTAGASEIVFALAWALGYRWAPRLADLPDQRLWRPDTRAHYGVLDGLARHRINARLITENWDEICRLTASLRACTVIPSAILRTLQRGPNPSSLARALAELRLVEELAAKAICNHCPVLAYCRDYAVNAEEPHGIWGGLSPIERKRQKWFNRFKTTPTDPAPEQRCS